jgi:ribosomal protein S18 acetylase RimI-like enzyme
VTPIVTHLGWDSEFFGVAVGRAEVDKHSLSRAIEEALEQRVECLYLFVRDARPSALTHALHCGGRLVDLRVQLDLQTPAPPSLPNGVRHADRREARALLPLARSLARESRFSADPRFPAHAVSEMYEIWLERCFDDGVVVVPAQGLGGFVGARPIEKGISVDLVYVDAGARGQGLGARLLDGAVATSGASEARVATQAWNITAQRLYQAAGFRIASIEAIVHLWLDELSNPRC